MAKSSLVRVAEDPPLGIGVLFERILVAIEVVGGDIKKECDVEGCHRCDLVGSY